MQHLARWEVSAVTVILLAAVGLRFWNLARVPDGLMPDEAGNVYDAWSILKTGADRWGHRHPVFLEGFGRSDYRPALYAYLTIPFVALWGPDRLDVAARCPAALAGVLTIVGLYGLVRRVSGTWAALAAATALTLCPWHLFVSRFGHEASLTPLFAVLILLAIERFFSTMVSPESRRGIVADGVLLGLVVGVSLYTYASMKLFVPLLLLGILMVWRRELSRGFTDRRVNRAMVLAVASCVLVALPMIWSTVTEWDKINARAQQQSLFHQGRPVVDVIARCAVNWVDHFSPRWLFFKGSDFAFFNTLGVGQLNWYLSVLGLLGLVRIYHTHRVQPFHVVLLLWLLVHPVASAVTVGSPHVLRAACGIGAFAWLGGLGAVELIERAARTVTVRRAVIAVVGAVVAVNATWSLRRYFDTYGHNRLMAELYQADLRDALLSIRNRWYRYDRLFVSDHRSTARRWLIDQPYIHVLTFLAIEPSVFQDWDKEIIPAADDAFETIRRMGIITMSTRPEVLKAYFDRHPGGRVLVVARPGDIRGGHRISVIDKPYDEVRFEVVEVGPPQRGM